MTDLRNTDRATTRQCVLATLAAVSVCGVIGAFFALPTPDPDLALGLPQIGDHCMSRNTLLGQAVSYTQRHPVADPTPDYYKSVPLKVVMAMRAKHTVPCADLAGEYNAIVAELPHH